METHESEYEYDNNSTNIEILNEDDFRTFLTNRDRNVLAPSPPPSIPPLKKIKSAKKKPVTSLTIKNLEKRTQMTDSGEHFRTSTPAQTSSKREGIKLNQLSKKRLIKCIKNNPAIWDLSSKQYSNNLIKSRSWRIIAEEIDLPESTCRATWKSLRNTIIIIARRTTAGNDEFDDEFDDDDADDDEINIEDDDQWEFASDLDFLIPTRNKRSTFVSNEDNSSSFGVYDYASSASTKKTDDKKDDIPIFFKNFFNKIEDKWEKTALIKEKKQPSDSLNQLKNKDMLLNIGKMLEPLNRMPS